MTMSMQRGPLTIAISVWCVLAGCSDDLGLSGYIFACVQDSECGAGWVCNPSTKVCELADTKDVDAPDGNGCSAKDLGTPEWAEGEGVLHVTDVGVDSITIEWEAAELPDAPECLLSEVRYRFCTIPTHMVNGDSVCDSPATKQVTGPDPGLSTQINNLPQATQYTIAIQACVNFDEDDQNAQCTQEVTASAITTSDQTVRSMMAAVDHSCAVLVDGSVWCWGSMSNYLLGNSVGSGFTEVPQRVQKRKTKPSAPVSYLDQVVKVAGGNSISCALRADGTVWCWGRLVGGPAGEINVLKAGEAREIDGLVGVVDLAASVATVVPVGHICALTVEGHVVCWGDNLNGQMGISPAEAAFLTGPIQVPNLVNVPVQQVGAGIGHTCALVDGEVQCWGSTSKGQTGVELGEPPNVTDVTDVTIVGEDGLGITARSLSVGAYHTCVIGEADTLHCWGGRDYGLFDGVVGTNEFFNYIPLEFALETIEKLSAGFGYNCVHDFENQWSCWGFNTLAQLGTGLYRGEYEKIKPTDKKPVDFSNAFGQEADETVVLSVVAGHSHACGTSHRGQGVCWGSKIGVKPSDPPQVLTTPQLVDGLVGPMNARTIAAAGNVSCALRADGEMRCWGEGDSEEANRNGSALIVTPDIVCVDTSSQVNCDTGFWDNDEMFSEGTVAPFLQKPQVKPETLVSNGKYVCALQVGGLASCEGSTDHELVSSTPDSQRFVSLTMGKKHVCGLQADNRVFCWGNNVHGQLGSTTGSVVKKVDPDGSGEEPIRARQISAGVNRTCAVLVDGSVYCWGQTQFDEPDQVGTFKPPGNKDFVSVALLDQGYCVLDATGKVECLPEDVEATSDGDNEGFLTDPTFPVPAIELVAGARHACVLLADGTVQCWGVNDEDQSGCDDVEWCATPTTIPLTD